ncbi:MAG: Uma2 family endonuclease [Caldilineaceae bacterium]|nr:Uma2 family endonuclease [Caldilineaceae bacterium]
MDTAVRAWTQMAVPASNGRAVELRPNADPTMTREAREARIAWRLEHLDEWQRGLEDLAHYDSGYAYDVAHEYDYDWTTDPDYGPEGIHLFEFDEDGVLYPDDDRPQAIELYMRDTARDLVGNRVVYQTRYGFVPEIAEFLGLRTRQGRPSNTVKPDLIVMPSEKDLDPARLPEDRKPRPDDAVPELVLEILSESTAARDLGDKQRLYEYLGVREYLVYDLGDKRWPGSPRELLLYRLGESGAYRQIDAAPGLSEPKAQAIWSEVFDAHIRMLPDTREESMASYGRAPRFQWWDDAQFRWRDRETDIEHEQERIVRERDQAVRERDQVVRANERITQERTNMAIALLRAHLGSELATHLNRIEATWHRDGLPTDVVARILKVRETPDAWHALLLPDELDDDRPPVPREPPPPKGSW